MDRSAVISAESDRFAQVLATADPDARVPTCPDWTVTDLAHHLAEVHDFWARVLADNVTDAAGVEAIENSKPERPPTLTEILALRADATRRLLGQLDTLSDEETRWSWWDPDQTVGFTRRMQTCEATMHRIDAEYAAGEEISPIDAEAAEAAVDHCVDVMWGWMPEWGHYEPLATVTFTASDTRATWPVEIGHWTGVGPESGNDFDWPRAVRAESIRPAAASGAVTGTAEQLARWAWNRGGTVQISGDDAAVAAIGRLIEHGIQ